MKKIGLIDLDATTFPNLALMKLSAFHKAQGDEVVLMREAQPVDRIYASAVFSWNRAKATAAAAAGAIVGGTGVDLTTELPPEVEATRPDYSLYGIDYGVGFLSRGCMRTCDFCVVPRKEGLPRQVATIDDLLNAESERPDPFVVLLDNQFFFKVRWAIDRLHEFTERGIDFCPSQGLDIRVVTPKLAEALAAAPYWNVKHSGRQITFAFDDIRMEARFRRGIETLIAAGIPGSHLQSFILVGFNSTIEEDLARIAILREYKADPFVMVYRDPASGEIARDPRCRHLARWANRRLYKVCDFKDYEPEARRMAQTVMAL